MPAHEAACRRVVREGWEPGTGWLDPEDVDWWPEGTTTQTGIIPMKIYESISFGLDGYHAHFHSHQAAFRDLVRVLAEHPEL